MSSVKTRAAILETALDLFYKHGFHAIGVDHIAKASGTTRQTLYNHFESKDEISLLVVQQRDQWWREEFRRLVQGRGGSDPIAQLRSVFDVLGEWFESNRFNGCLFINAASAFPTVTDPIHQAAKANVDAIRAFISELATEAELKAPDAFARQFTLIIEGAIVSEVIDRDSRAANDASRLAVALIDRHVKT